MNFHLIAGGQRAGPFTLDQLRERGIDRDTQVWHSGQIDWRPAGQVPELQELLRSVPPPLPEPPPLPAFALPVEMAVSVSLATQPKGAWDPVTLAWLGMLFTPIWSAIMAAINARRLGLVRSWWIPLLVPTGFIVEELIRDAFHSLDAWWIDASVYGLAVWLVWRVELRYQTAAFAKAARPEATLLAPCLIGSPLALLAGLALLIAPFLPLEPRQVCEKFDRATTAAEAMEYTTPKMHACAQALLALSDDDDNSRIELLDEGPAPPDIGGYFVGLRMSDPTGAHLEGFYHLVKWLDRWRIDEICLTSANGQRLGNPIYVSRDYAALLANRPPPGAAGAAKGKPMAPWVERALIRGSVQAIINSKEWQKHPKAAIGFVLGLLALPFLLIAGVFRLLKKLFAPASTEISEEELARP